MISPHFLPVKHFGVNFDRGMCLFEFSALREPEATRFPLIGDFCRQHCEFVRVPTPQVLYQEPLPYQGIRYLPDYFISNQTKAWQFAHHAPKTSLHPSRKAEFTNDIDYEIVSLINHGSGLHANLEQFCQKVCGLSTSQIVAKYHRAVWLPMYWSETLGTDWPTEFFYPKAGYAGALAERLGTAEKQNSASGARPDIATTELRLAFCLASVRNEFSVLFIPELRREGQQSPIYRITDQDYCAGIQTPKRRLVVEYRGDCDVAADLAVLGIEVRDIAYGSGRIVPPTRANVEAGYDFGNHMNAQIWRGMNENAA